MIDIETGHYFTPCSIKGLVVREGSVLLCLNPRGEWELPGGWPSPEDVTIQDTLTREVLEETGQHVAPEEIVDAEILATPSDGRVVLIMIKAVPLENSPLRISHEHQEIRYFELDLLPSSTPSVYRRAIRKLRRGDGAEQP